MSLTSQPKISVVIFSYNFETYLGECIESILAQTLQPFEIIICDDHSTDDSWKIISRFSRQYPELIKAYQHEENIGQVHNGNFGREIAQGDLITLLDGDDRWLPRKLELEWATLQQRPHAKIAYSNVYVIDAEGNRMEVWCEQQANPPPSGDVFVEVFSRKFFPDSGSIFRNQLIYRNVLNEVGHTDESLESFWDWDEKIRLTARYEAVYSGEALVEYRRHDQGFSKNNPERHFRAMVQVYEKNLPLLNQRSDKEMAQVRCRLEVILARQQMSLPLSEQLDYYSAYNVYNRIYTLLNQLLKIDRLALEEQLSPLVGQLLYHEIMEKIKKGNIRRAFQSLWMFFRDSQGRFGVSLFGWKMFLGWISVRLQRG